jgi:penicillin-binding protein 1A
MPSRPPTAGSRLVLRAARQAGLAVVFVVTAVLGTVGGVLFAFGGDMPQIEALDSYQPNTITRMYARDGRLIGEYATERRVVIGHDDVAPALRQAILASEDAGFEQHFGLSVPRIAMAALRDVLYGQPGGASTITQQVARILFLQEQYMRGGRFERSFERKIKEALLAIQLEKRYTKREILTFYLNHVHLGHGAEGVEAASRLYFDKAAAELSLDEAATIAAVIQTPARVNPFVNPQATLARRNNYVLRRMVDEGHISADEAAEAAERPLVTRGQRTADPWVGPHFNEEVRKMLARKYGTDALYQAGLQVHTTLDADLQAAANAAVGRHLRELDKRLHRFRRAARNVAIEGRVPDALGSDDADVSARWARPILAGDIVPAVVTTVSTAAQGGAARVRVGSHDIELPRTAFAWTGRNASADLFTVGDVVEVEVRAVDGSVPSDVRLEQPPAMEAALVAIENHTGQILAMVGGHSFTRSEFNRAVQAQRQVGSLFKAVVYAAAIDRGYTPVSVFVDEPVAYEVGPNQPLYRPGNFDGRFEGPVTLRRALEVSRNIPAVKAMLEIGTEQVIGYAHRFGLRGNYPPYHSVALGAIESSLLDLTSAYSVFPNQGVRMEPYAVQSITDREGNLLEETRPRSHQAIRADTAFIMTNLLRGVVQRGTAAPAGAALPGWPLAGKTGTVNDYTDAWFIGFDPDITVGVWVGYDVKTQMGRETGGTAALPIWTDVMRAYLEQRPDRDEPPAFDPPGNIIFVTLDSGFREAFISGTQPQEGFPFPTLPPPGDTPAPADAAAVAPPALVPASTPPPPQP